MQQQKLKHCTPFTGFNLVPYEYDEHECNTVMVLDHDKLFCVSVGERASSVDDINSMTQIPDERDQASLISTLSSMRAIGILSPCLFRREKWR